MQKLLLSMLISLFLFIPALADEKLKAEEIIAKHLESIGKKEVRSKIKNIVGSGVSYFAVLRTTSKTTGKFVIASQNEKLLFGSNFSNPNYPQEQMTYNGKDVSVAYISPGIRSALGNFVFTNKDIFNEGLFGGVLSTAWAVKNLAAKKAKVETGGKKKINETNTYVLEYLPKGGSDLVIKFFFDAETFHHIRTEYSQIISARMGANVNDSARQRESRNTMIEDFSNFKEVDGLTLPHSHKVYILNDGQRGTNEFEWKFDFETFLFNQNLAENSFDLAAQ